MTKPLPKEITSHDLLKTVALILMVVDHIGFFFYPGQLWFRVIGRFSAPIWFFLIGYAETRDVQKGIWIGGAIVTLVWVITGQYLLPINILFTLGACRLMIDGVMARALRTTQTFWGMVLILFFLTLPSMLVAEYGTLGLMFAMLGFIARHRPALSRTNLTGFIAAASLSWAFYNAILLGGINGVQMLCLFAGLAVLCHWLYYFFKAATWPNLSRILGPLGSLVRLLGRKTLEFYVIHIIVLTSVAMVLQPARFVPFQFQLAPPGLLHLFL